MNENLAVGVCESEWSFVFVCFCGPVMNWQLWDRIQQSPATMSAGRKRALKMDLMDRKT